MNGRRRRLARAADLAAGLLLLAVWGGALGAFYEWGGPAARGVRQLKKGENANAIGSLGAGRRDLPRSAAVRYDRGLAFRRLGLADSARASYEDAMLQVGPKARAAAAYNLGNDALRAGRVGEAIERYRESLREDSSREDAKKNLEEAIRQARKAKPNATPPSSQGPGGQGPPGPGRGQGAPSGPPPRSSQGGGPNNGPQSQAPKNVGGPIPSKGEAELWLNALESERRAERERDRKTPEGPERRGRDW
ncbi:MAG TPA: tetratricopeptide repeat protein [Candidatus Eisenbacteria bacterium]